MAFGKNKFFIGLILISFSSWPLSKLVTKQSPQQIRMIDPLGKYLLYQNSSGDLLLSTNYKIRKILTKKEGTQYTVLLSPKSNKIAVEVDETFHNNISMYKNNQIYLINTTTHSNELIGEGNEPMFHLSGDWFSYLNNNTIYFRYLKDRVRATTLNFEIKLKNKFNKLFKPQIIMLDNNTIIYSDISEEGKQGILLLKRKEESINKIFIAQEINKNLELCYNNGNIYLGQFSFLKRSAESSIARLIVDGHSSKTEEIYHSKSHDIGHINCTLENDKIFFIKDNSTLEKEISNLYVINVKDKKLKQLSTLNRLTNFIQMGNRLIIESKGDYYTYPDTLAKAEDDKGVYQK